MATPAQPQPTVSDDERCVGWWGLGWKGYATLRRLRGERRWPRMVYLDGDLFLMSPLEDHEHLAGRLGIFVMEVVVGLGIPCIHKGSTTLRRRKKRGGIEPAGSFYLANAARVLGRPRIDLRTDPPPDLTIEMVRSQGADEAVEVYRRLKVPEVWACDTGQLRILVRQADRRYAESATSLAFPFLSCAEIADWINRS